jgi:hypothetical protein
MKVTNTTPWLKNLLLAILLIALLVQVFLLLETQGPRTIEIYKSIGQPGRWRGANFAFSQETANFYRFLDESIPTDALVLIPVDTGGPEALTRDRYVEFFLWPRSVAYCEETTEVCIRQSQDKNVAVLITAGLGLNRADDPGERLVLFNDAWGVYLPNNASMGNAQPTFNSFFELAVAGFPPIVLIAALALPGYSLARRTLPNEHPLAHSALGIGTGLGWLSLSLFFALWIGAELSSFLIFVIVIVYLFLAGVIWLALKRTHALESQIRKFADEEIWILLVFLVPIAWATVLAIGNAYSHTDEIVLWGAKGYGIPAAGLQHGVTERGTLTTWYPLNIPLLISSFLTLFGERLPESKFIFPAYFFGFTAMIYAFFRKQAQPLISLLGTLLIATIPAVFLMGTMAHANLPFAFYLIGGILMLYFAQQANPSTSPAYWSWGVVFLVLAAWTRPEGIYLAWAIAATAVIFYRSDLMKAKNKLIWLFCALGLFSIFWYFAAASIYLKPGFTEGIFSLALNQVLQGNLHFGQAIFILKSFLGDSFLLKEWGTIAWLLIAFVILAFGKAKISNSNLYLIGSGFVILLAIWGVFVANSYASLDFMDIGRWVNTALMRLAFPGLILIWLQLFGMIAHFYFPLPATEAT